MDNLNRFAAVVFFAISCAAEAKLPVAPRADTTGAPREVRWEELVPKDWNPYKELQRKNPMAANSDSPEASAAMREIWDGAPTVAALDNTPVKLAGYVVPLEMSGDAVREFLLVPYFGACIHMPPPPANQIVHVVMATPSKGLRAMAVVWAAGTLRTRRLDSAMGASGYRIEGASTEAYTAKR